MNSKPESPPPPVGCSTRTSHHECVWPEEAQLHRVMLLRHRKGEGGWGGDLEGGSTPHGGLRVQQAGWKRGAGGAGGGG